MTNGKNLFAGANSGVYFSTDNGDNWINRNAGLIDSNINKIILDGDNIELQGSSF